MAKCKRDDDVNYEEDLDRVDLNNYKGMFFQDDPGRKYQDTQTGAHFEFRDMCRRLNHLRRQLPATQDSSRPENVRDDTEDCIQKRKINESGSALRTREKESRNAAQVLVYSTTAGTANTIGGRVGLGRNKENGRLGPGLTYVQCKEPSIRCKSSDKKYTASKTKPNGPVKASFIGKQPPTLFDL